MTIGSGLGILYMPLLPCVRLRHCSAKSANISERKTVTIAKYIPFNLENGNPIRHARAAGIIPANNNANHDENPSFITSKVDVYAPKVIIPPVASDINPVKVIRRRLVVKMILITVKMSICVT